MSTYGAMQDRIQNELKRQDLSAEVRLAINSAISHYQSNRFFFNTNRATRDTSSSQEYYGLPTDYISLDSVVLTQNDSTWYLDEESFDMMERMATSPTHTGFPARYAVYQEQLRLYPIPDGVYSMRMSYIRSLTAVSATSDTNAWFTTGEEMIRNRAKADLLRSVIRGQESFQEADVYQSIANDEYTRLRKETAKREVSGHIHPMKL